MKTNERNSGIGGNVEVRVTLNFSVSIDKNGIPDPIPSWIDPKDGHRASKRQQRLMQVLLSNEQSLHEFFAYLVSIHLQGIGFSQWDNFIFGKQEVTIEDVLSSSLAKLDQGDQEHFKEEQEAGSFYDAVQELNDCFKTTLDSAVVKEVTE